MAKYTQKAQVLFTERQYQGLQEIAEEEGKPLGTLLRQAAEEVYLRRKRSRDKAQAVTELLALKETEVPEDYQNWEQTYQREKYGGHG
ncbi:MAG: hypothetical protein ACE5JX_02525 [Acidobacteriota bacterium]